MESVGQRRVTEAMKAVIRSTRPDAPGLTERNMRRSARIGLEQRATVLLSEGNSLRDVRTLTGLTVGSVESLAQDIESQRRKR